MLRRFTVELSCFASECAVAALACAAAVALAAGLLGSLALGHVIEVFNPGYARRARGLELPAPPGDRLWSRMDYTRG